MRLSELCIRRPVMTTLLMASLLLAGFFGYRQLPIAAIPRIEVPTITVTAQYPGRQPRHHGGLGRRARWSASSPPSPASPPSPRSAPRATPRSRWSSISTAISMPPRSTRSRPSRLPPRACPRTCRRRPPTARSTRPTRPVIFLALTSDTALSQEMNEFADKVMSPRLSMLPGVAQVNIQGAQKRAVRIKYDLDALATRGISVEDIRQAVSALASVSPIGSIRTQHQLYILEIKGAEPTAAYFKPVVVAWRNGAPVRLQDIAKVEDSRRERRGARRVQRQALDHRLGAAPARRQHGRGHRRRPQHAAASSSGCCRRPSSSAS